MIEQIRGQGGDDMHFRNGGRRLDAADRLPMYLSDFEPEELEPKARAARDRILDGCPTTADEELDDACRECGDRHRPDFGGDCRNDYQSFTEMDPQWRNHSIEPDYVCRGGHEWVNRLTLRAALAADAVRMNAPPETRRADALGDLGTSATVSPAYGGIHSGRTSLEAVTE